MNGTKRVARILTVLAGVSMLSLVGPAAFADNDSGGHPENQGNHGNQGNQGSHGNPSPTPIVTDDHAAQREQVREDRDAQREQVREDRDAQREQVREDRAALREARAQLREEVRAEGGTWGAVVRQETLLRVATRLAERHEQAPTSAALGRILTHINAGLPVALQIDIAAFLARYELVFADLIKPSDDSTDETPEPSPEPSPSASV